jgi:hypothetical protein
VATVAKARMALAPTGAAPVKWDVEYGLRGVVRQTAARGVWLESEKSARRICPGFGHG